jgi:hypothetical protein
MNNPSCLNPRVRLRLALRAMVGAWKQWREPPLDRKMRHELAVCAIFREEAPFLDEWLTFHAGIGVTHFYLYNNLSTDNFREVLRPWQAAGFVTLIEWPAEPCQIPAYQDCVRRFKHHARWIAFFDIDEFLFSPQSRSLLPVLETFAHRPGIEVWQIIFGSNGHVKRPASVIASYTLSAPAKPTTVKTIANPRLVYKVHIHQFKYWRGQGLDTSGQVVNQSTTPVYEPLRMNHYWSRSLEDLNIKIRRGRCANLEKRDPEKHLAHERGLNCEPDFTILPIARAIRKPAAVEKAARETSATPAVPAA